MPEFTRRPLEGLFPLVPLSLDADDEIDHDGIRHSIHLLAAGGVPGCIGFGWWEKESAYEATIWDMKQAKSAGSVGTNVTGTSAIIGAVVPLPFIARVESAACDRMAGQLRTFFHGSGAPTTAATAATGAAN